MIFLADIAGLADPGTKGVVLGEGEDALDIVVVRVRGACHAYVNACPHQSIPLETFPDRFLTADGRHMVCSGHGALFTLDDGRCVSGPCEGRSLQRLATAERDGALYLTEACSPEEIARARRLARRW